MNVVTSSKIEAGLKKMKLFLIWGLLCFAICIVSIGWIYYLSSDTKDAIPMNSLISNGNTKSTYAEVEITSSPYAFAEYDNKTEKYYYVFDSENLMYVVYLPLDLYNQLNREASLENPVVIRGMTKPIAEDIRKLAIEVYNEASEEEFLTNENFENYLGAIYLDATQTSPDNTVPVVLAVFSGLAALFLILLGILARRRAKKVINQFSEEEWRQIETELERSDTISYTSLGLHFTENYVVILNSSMAIFSYQDILWMYPYVLRQYGLATNKSIMLVTSDKRRHNIANIPNFSKKAKKNYNDIMSFLHDKNPNCLIGYTKENIRLMKEKHGIK